jgi:hypothetical protein
MLRKSHLRVTDDVVKGRSTKHLIWKTEPLLRGSVYRELPLEYKEERKKERRDLQPKTPQVAHGARAAD